MTKAPRTQGPSNRITNGSTVPLPIPLSDARAVGFDANEVERLSGMVLRTADGLLDPGAVKRVTGIKLKEMDLPEIDLRTYLCWRALVYFAGDIDPEVDSLYTAPAAEVRRFIQQGAAHESSDNLKQALLSLVGTAVRIRYAERGKSMTAIEPLATIYYENSSLRDGRGYTVGDEISFRFPPIVRRMLSLSDPKILWHRVELGVLAKCRSTHEARFYELLTRYHDRRTPVIEMDAWELADQLGIPEDSSYRKDWKDFRNRVLCPVMDMLEEDGVFKVVDFQEERSGGRGRGGGKVKKVRITVARKDALAKAERAVEERAEQERRKAEAAAEQVEFDTALGDMF